MMLLRLIATTLLLLPFTALAQETVQQTVRVPPGSDNRIAGYNLTRIVKDECQGGSLPAITITVPPTIGKAETRTAPVQVAQVFSGRNECMGKTVDGTIIVYRAPAGFTGEDKLTAEINFGGNHPVRTVHYLIKVDPSALHRDPMTNQVITRFNRVVYGSMESVLARFNRLAAGCKPDAPPQIKVIGTPREGALRFDVGEVGSWRAASGTQPRCVDVTVPSRDVFYTAKAGAKGRDSFRLLVEFGSGEVWDTTFEVDIR